MTIKKGRRYKSMDTGVVIKLTNKSHDTLWQARVLNKGKNKVHKVYEKTLHRYYREVK